MEVLLLGYIEQEIEHRTLCTEHLSITSDHLYWCTHLTHALTHIMVHILMDIMVHILTHFIWCIPWCIPFVPNCLVSGAYPDAFHIEELVDHEIHTPASQLVHTLVHTLCLKRPCLKRSCLRTDPPQRKSLPIISVSTT